MLSSRRAPPSPGGVPVAKPRTTIQLLPRPAPTEGGEPRPAIKCAMPQCLDQRRTYAVGHELRSDERPGPGSAQADASHVVGPDAPDVSQDSASFVLGLTSPGAGRQPRTWRSRTRGGRERGEVANEGRSRTRASVSDYYLACGRARRRPSITVDWTAARWKRRHRRDPGAARRPHRRKPPRCASRSTGQAGAVRCRPTSADRTLPRRA
jgi:hypothetical protein